jgi:hypothetical protein
MHGAFREVDGNPQWAGVGALTLFDARLSTSLMTLVGTYIDPE